MDKDVYTRFAQYPDNVRVRLVELRALILSLANELDVGEVEESLKWGEPSYSVKFGSPIRLDWKIKSPTSYYLFFHCQTKLVDTFRELYADELVFQGNRAIVLSINEPLKRDIVKHCLTLAMTYQQRKHLPMLGG
ncbi:hypothetical protein JCM19235_5978 [Vibrio maritimus]|uniref:YdhG-like domain-containing protein n=1 Tax=Vibrio maritimus TaxID=990268 RepID=A0A090RT94_9VIBR|nr:hypothetical protein JCM19235_5978 [Vibrio maritimus]